MNKAEWLNVLLAVAVVILSVKTAFFNQGSPSASKEQPTEEAVLGNLMTRTSIRSYRDRPVEDEKVEKLLRAAMAAPSAGNKQPWKFVVIKDKQTLKSLSEHFNTMKMAEHAPLAIVVCGDMEKTFPADGRDYWVEDTSAASENLLLAAHAMGLGAVWCGIYPMQERVAWLKQLLQLPENIVPLNVIPIGYPAEAPAPKDKWNPAHIHYETWGGAAGVSAALTRASALSEPAAWTKVDPAELRENPFTLFNNVWPCRSATKTG